MSLNLLATLGIAIGVAGVLVISLIPWRQLIRADLLPSNGSVFVFGGLTLFFSIALSGVFWLAAGTAEMLAFYGPEMRVWVSLFLLAYGSFAGLLVFLAILDYIVKVRIAP